MLPWVVTASTKALPCTRLLATQNGMGTNAGLGTHTVESPGSGAPARAPLALSDIDLTMQRIYQNGGKANKLMLSPKLRRDFSDLMVTDSGVRRNIDMDGKLRQSVDVYMSDFGDVMVVPNYIMGLSNYLLFRVMVYAYRTTRAEASKRCRLHSIAV